MTISASDVKALREKTGVGMMDCKKALNECKGDMEKSIDYLRKKGMAAVQKKQSRIAAEGIIGSYIHNGKIGVMVEVNCETDFVAKGDDFQIFARDIAMHIAAADPKFLKAEDIDEEYKNKEVEIFTAQLKEQGKPDKIIPGIIQGKLKKMASEVCLYEQKFVKDPDKTINDLLNEITLKIGEKIQIRRFTKYNLGEGIKKREDNLADEIAKMTGGSK